MARSIVPCPVLVCAVQIVAASGAAMAEMIPYTRRWDVQFQSMRPNELFDKLDLTRPGLATVKAAADRGDRHAAMSALLDYYRTKFPMPIAAADTAGSLDRHQQADATVRHVFQWGPYEAADYGPDMNWEWDPRGDIEWVAWMYRFLWVPPLARAYAETHDEKYARAFVDLVADWIAKHPLEKWTRTHPVYARWRGFAWLDLQTGIRATSLCEGFKTFVHSEAFTPEFLARLLASLYDHQIKTETVPMGVVHNKAIFEQRGFAEVARTFDEFADAGRWARLALERSRENLLAQTTTDGVQREWSGGYHLGVLRDAVAIMKIADEMGVTVPSDYRDRVRAMHDYLFAIATPDLGFPMFGDCARPPVDGLPRSRWPLSGPLIGATELLGNPKYAARAKLDRDALPAQTDYAFREAGLYVMRSGWGPEQIYLVLHCSPPAISGHDQPDNGTFELYAFGRWLMTDTGFYTYGGDQKARQWHRETARHQTLTLGGADAKVAGEPRLWSVAPDLVTLTVENESYPNLRHRRTVWFVDRRFFVLLDEAIGDAPGPLDLHFQLAVGPARLDPAAKSAATQFDDANVLIQAAAGTTVAMEEEEGWFAAKYGSRERRTAFRYRHAAPAPTAFLTIISPYQSMETPDVSGTLSAGFVPGSSKVELSVEVLDRKWRLGRDLETARAWATQP